MLYFAYGSNLLKSRMLSRCPSAEVVCVDVFKGYVLTFNKLGVDGTAKANISKSLGDVRGVIYTIDSQDVKKLDATEGEGVHYTRTKITTTKGISCWTYVACVDKIVCDIYPSHQYKNMIIKGMEAFKFPVSYISRVYETKSVNK